MGTCRVCAHQTQQVISLGRMPLANGFLARVADQEFFYNLSVAFCPGCFMVQLEETVEPERLFNEQYQFISSTSKVMEAHFAALAQEICGLVSGKEKPFVVELGCNDGIMLKHIAGQGVSHLGIEPAQNVACLARKNGVRVLEGFFNETTAGQIVKDYGQAEVICGSNVFCHMPDINSAFRGIDILLKADGILFFEDPYVLDIVQKTSFDQIYDEHVYYFCGLAIAELAKRHGMQLVDMAHQEVHGGSMRYYIRKGMSHTPHQGVAYYIAEEKRYGLDRLEGYGGFKERVDKVCLDLKDTLRRLKEEGNRIAGYGATSKSTTLLNYARIGPELLEYICDITPNKINKFTPGMHILIKSYEAFVADRPLYTLLLAWNHKTEILEKEKGYRQRGGKFITYFPGVLIE